MARRRSGALYGTRAYYVDCDVLLCLPLSGVPKLRLSEARKVVAIQEPVGKARRSGDSNPITGSGALIAIYRKMNTSITSTGTVAPPKPVKVVVATTVMLSFISF